MNIEDIKNYIIRYNLDEKNRKRYAVDQRTYLYAYLYHELKISCSQIGKMFKRSHATIIFSLKSADTIQHQDEFINNTEHLNSILKFVIPSYNSNDHRVKNVEQYPYKQNYAYSNQNKIICIELDKESFTRYIEGKNIDVVYDFLWNKMKEQGLERTNKITKNRKLVNLLSHIKSMLK